jgi:NNP family nitrate/nitrite transporter-like MFS transporter
MAFGALLDLTGVWTSCFMLMFLIVATSFLWMHAAIVRMERKRYPQLSEPGPVPELAEGVVAADVVTRETPALTTGNQHA